MKIAVAGTGYVGLSISCLIAQHHTVCAVDLIKSKVDSINNRKSPIQDEYIEKYLAEKDLDLTATLDGESAYADADFVIIAAPTPASLDCSISIPDLRYLILFTLIFLSRQNRLAAFCRVYKSGPALNPSLGRGLRRKNTPRFCFGGLAIRKRLPSPVAAVVAARPEFPD